MRKMNVKEMSLPMPKNGKPMTEQDYLQTCNTEQLAEEVYKLVWCSNELFQQMECSGIDTKENDLKIVTVWLKQPHQERKRYKL